MARRLSTTGEVFIPIEHVASGHEVCAWDFEASSEWVCTEAKRVSNSIPFAYSRNDRCHAFSFSERRASSGHRELIPRVSLDETLRQDVSRETFPLLKRTKLAEEFSKSRAPLSNDTDPMARRHIQNLMMEAHIRTQMASISKSWRGVQSGIASYARFMDGTLPQVRHFPATLISLRLWALHFDSGDTLRTYVRLSLPLRPQRAEPPPHRGGGRRRIHH